MGTDARGFLTEANEVNEAGFQSLFPPPARDRSELPSAKVCAFCALGRQKHPRPSEFIRG